MLAALSYRIIPLARMLLQKGVDTKCIQRPKALLRIAERNFNSYETFKLLIEIGANVKDAVLVSGYYCV